jgi:hypothetical protein
VDDLPFEFQPPGAPPRRSRPAPRRTSRALLLTIAGVALVVGVLAGSAFARRPTPANLQTLTQDVRIVTVTVTAPQTG